MAHETQSSIEILNPHHSPTKRRVTVSRLSQGPAVRLTGKWLSQLGFEAGVRVVVETEPGRLVLTIDSGRY